MVTSVTTIAASRSGITLPARLTSAERARLSERRGGRPPRRRAPTGRPVPGLSRLSRSPVLAGAARVRPEEGHARARASPARSGSARFRRGCAKASSRSVFSSSARLSGVSNTPPEVSRIHNRSASGRASASTARNASGPSALTRSSGSLPSGSSAKRSVRPGLDQRQRHVGGAPRRLQPGLVAVEAQHRLAGHAPQQFQLVLGQRGAERRHGVLEAGLRQRDHVHVAFDGDHRAVLPLRLSGAREIVEHIALVEELGLGRVHVFGRALRAPARGRRRR